MIIEKETTFTSKILVGVCFLLWLNFFFEKNLFVRFSQVKDLQQIKVPLGKYFILDTIGHVFGLRRVVSDIAWIQLLQYYGSEYIPEEEGIEERKDNHEHEEEHLHNHYEHITKYQPGKYNNLLRYCQRIIRIDPHYSYVYFYGSASLAWNLFRQEEALELIREGLQWLSYQKYDSESDYWTLVLYQAAIIYKQGEQYRQMLAKIEEIVSRGSAPMVLKSVLLNLYKKFGEYDKAKNLCYELLNSPDLFYRERARKVLLEIGQIK